MIQKLLTLKQASQIVNIPTDTIRYWLAQGKCEIPFNRLPNGRIVISESALMEWMQTLPKHRGVAE
jgi:excisionase family DNA binding protein